MKITKDEKRAFKEFMEIYPELDTFTAPPEDGDYDEHIQRAMESVYVKTIAHMFEAMRLLGVR